ncbi:MAG TPA: hypothetical protein ENJ45_05775, partial [Phaeodactylibacter sp.]|nr:hypothetical protein [Phaeodactylibacter sp.]
MKQNIYSNSFKVFLGLNILLMIGSLLLVNDYATIWSGAEAYHLWTAQQASAHSPSTLLIEKLYQSIGLSPFGLRLPGVITLLATAALFYHFGKKVFGRDAVVLTLLVAGSSFMLIPFGKFISGDVYLLFAQMAHLLSTILYLKRPLPRWRVSNYIFLGIGLSIHPLAMSLWAIGLGVMLWLKHPKRENLKKLYLPVSLMLVALALLGQSYYGLWHFLDFRLSYGQLPAAKAYLLIVISLLPFLGFLPAVLLDLYRKWKKDEELAVILSAWLLAAVASLSLSLLWVLSFM